MRWRGGRQSGNIEDRRGLGVPLVAGGGIGTIVLLLLAVFFGFDPGLVTDGDGPGGPPASQSPSASPPAADDLRTFVAVVLADTEDTWRELFQRAGRRYREPILVLFTGSVQSACGMAGAAVGPFYCPADQKLYLDLDFFRALRERFAAAGDFAQAYVIAHEVGHHVQALLGITSEVAAARRRADEGDGNALSVQQELQADCLAGIWAHHAQRARDILEEGDLQEALAAAAAIGDDQIQRRSRGRVVPDSFTHGSSRQRVRWFARGFETGELGACDTFRAAEL
jgi:predicted metalloprotease